jgi:hypothetical protein
MENALMNLRWFKQSGILFVPANAAGWMVLLGGIAYAVSIFIDIDNRSHSVSDTLINFVFNPIIIAAGSSVVGFLTSKRAKN